MATQFNFNAHSEMLPMEVGPGVAGANSFMLRSPDGNYSLRIPALGPYGFLKVGDHCIITLGLCRIAQTQVPDMLPGLAKGLKAPEGMN